MCIALAITAAKLGAVVTNHVEVVNLQKEKNEKGEDVICGAQLKERFTGEILIIILGDVFRQMQPFFYIQYDCVKFNNFCIRWLVISARRQFYLKVKCCVNV